MLRIHGNASLRYAIVFSILSGRKLQIERVTPFSPAELSFLELIDCLTAGSRSLVNSKKTRLSFMPGSLSSDAFSTSHFHCLHRSISFYLEPVLLLGVYSAEGLNVEFTGITNDCWDAPADYYRDQVAPLLEQLFDLQGLLVKINKRGFKGNDGGSVEVRVPAVKKVLPAISK